MKNKLIIGIITVVVVLIGGYYMFSDNFSGGTYAGNVGFFQTATSGAMTITSDAQILATSSSRGYVIICNDSSQVVYLGLDADKPVTLSTAQVRLNASGGCYEINDLNRYWGAIRASSTNETSSNLLISEYKAR